VPGILPAELDALRDAQPTAAMARTSETDRTERRARLDITFDKIPHPCVVDDFVEARVLRSSRL